MAFKTVVLCKGGIPSSKLMYQYMIPYINCMFLPVRFCILNSLIISLNDFMKKSFHVQKYVQNVLDRILPNCLHDENNNINLCT